MKKDMFGFNTQGVKYDKFRPQYPRNFFTEILRKVPKRRNYLDIATGTGKVLFQLTANFTKSKGIDISEKMIDVFQSKVDKMKLPNISLETVDYMKWKSSQKYNLITVGQALHWFPVEESLQKMKGDLKDDGLLVVYGYFLKGLMGAQGEPRPAYQELYNNFHHKKIKTVSNFDIDQLEHCYSDKQKYPFHKMFRVEKQVYEIKTKITKEALIGYLKSTAAYNTYLEKVKEDPIKEIEENLKEDELTTVEDYFVISCSKL